MDSPDLAAPVQWIAVIEIRNSSGKARPLCSCPSLLHRKRPAEAYLFDYIEPFYKRKRCHSTLGYASPQQFLKNWISTQHEQQLAE
jgi:hypothetical protein